MYAERNTLLSSEVKPSRACFASSTAAFSLRQRACHFMMLAPTLLLAMVARLRAMYADGAYRLW